MRHGQKNTMIIGNANVTPGITPADRPELKCPPTADTPEFTASKGSIMKKIAALTLLSLSLAACSQGTGTPSATSTHGIVPYNATSPIYANTQAAYDALVAADLSKLSSQALAQQVYLNVLPIAGSTDSVRAYVKSSFASPVTCDLNFGDGSAAVSVQSPTTSRIQTLDHAYSTFGSYTVTVTCVNGGTVVGTGNVTIRAGRRSTSIGTVINFENPPAPTYNYNSYVTYQENGFTFSNSLNGSYLVYQFAKDYGGPGGYNLGDSQTLYTVSQNDSLTMRATDNAPFTLNSLQTGEVFHGQTNDYVITGHKVNGTTVSVQTSEVADTLTTLSFGPAWTDLTSVTFGGPGNIILDNIDVTPGTLNPL